MEISAKFKTEMDALGNIDFKALERMQEFGQEYNFREPAGTLNVIFKDLSNVLQNASRLRVTDQVEQQVGSLVTGTLELVSRINAFKWKDNETNASGEHKSIHDAVKNLYQDDLSVIVPLNERAENQKLRTDEVKSEIIEALDAVKQIKKASVESEEAKKNLDSTIKEIRDALGTEGASFSNLDFEKQATEHERFAKYWLLASIFVLVLFVIMTFLLFRLNSLSVEGLKNEYPRIIQIALFKVVLLSVGYLVLYQCIKSYKINRHLYITNRHRELTLKVYRLMVQGTSDPVQSNTILGQAVKAIFDPNVSGYLDGEENPNPINLTEIVNKVADKV